METLSEPLLPTRDGTVPTNGETIVEKGIRVVFKDLEYLLPSNTERGKIATVLHRMSGYFNAGEMTTIMGPSGCGKSMMMDVLAGRRTSGKINGIVTYAGTQPTQMFLRRVTGYVEQFGTLIENLTVLEMLMYTAELKRPMSESYQSKKKSVNDLIGRLALEKCRNTKIGDPQLDRGISGGQAKRVNIGIALITNPRVLYMDEPISGLDSYTSNEVMRTVKNLASEGTTLVVTLHSPTPYTFNLFDKIFLLLRGRVVYFGSRDPAIPYFQNISTTPTAISADTDAEWLTDVIVKADAAGQAGSLARFYDASVIRREVLDSVNKDFASNKQSDNLLQESSDDQGMVTPFWFGIKTYLKYRTRKNYRDSAFWLTRLPDKIVLTLLAASVYWGLGDDFSVDNFTNIAAIFFSWTLMSAFGSSVYIPILFMDRQLFYREHRDGLFRVVTYFLVKMIEEISILAILAFGMSFVLWHALDLQGSFAIFYFVLLGNLSCGLACAFLFVNLAPNIDAAVGGLATYLMTAGVYSGFYIRISNMPSYLVWYSKISFMRYSFGALILNHYDSSDQARRSMIPSGDDPTQTVPVTEYFGFHGMDKVAMMGYVYLFAIGYALLAYLTMQYIRFERHS